MRTARLVITAPVVGIAFCFLMVGCDFASTDHSDSAHADTVSTPVCPDRLPEHLPLKEGTVFEYDYKSHFSGGPVPYQSRTRGTLTWTVSTSPTCVGTDLVVDVEEVRSTVSERFYWERDDPEWQVEDSSYSTTTLQVKYNGKLHIPRYLLDPIDWQSVDVQKDTLEVLQRVYRQDRSLTFVRGVGIIRWHKWETVSGLADGDITEDITLYSVSN